MDGGSFSGLLTLVFVVLKLTHVIAWSWWWVLSPLLISFGLGLIFLTVIVVIALITGKSARGRLSAYQRSLTKRR